MEKNGASKDGLELRYKRYKRTLKELTIMSDAFMRNVFKKQECTEYLLRVIMEEEELKIVEQVLQKDYKNLQGRSAVLDCVARASGGKYYNVEIQQETEGASTKRARYHSGLLDMNTLNPGKDFSELPETCVIFITRKDTLGCGLPICHVERRIKETGENFKDESHIIYVNAGKQEDTELGRLIHDLNCKNADEMYSRVLADRVRELKETEKGVEAMCLEMEKIYQEGREEGREEGIETGYVRGMETGIVAGEMKAKKEAVISLAEMGITVEKIAQAVRMSVTIVQDWITESMGMAR